MCTFVYFQHRQSGNGSKNVGTTFRFRLFADWISRERDRVKFPLVSPIKSTSLKPTIQRASFPLLNKIRTVSYSRFHPDGNAVTHGFDRSSSWNFRAFLPRATINLRFLSGLAFRVKLCPFPLARLHTRSIVVRLIKADEGVASDVKSRQKVRVGTWWLFEPWRLHRSSCNWREEDTSRHFSPSRG